VVWFSPGNAFDSSWSLATQDRYDNQGHAATPFRCWSVGSLD
jgi:hypothetical protein